MNQIVSIQIEKGRVHDLTIARKYVKEFTDTSCVMADLAYKGFKEIDGKLLIPIKKPRKRELTKEAKKINKEISRRRIPIEHINSKLKVFRILSERYRNRRKRFGLRMNLIAGLVNWMIKKRLTQEVYCIIFRRAADWFNQLICQFYFNHYCGFACTSGTL